MSDPWRVRWRVWCFAAVGLSLASIGCNESIRMQYRDAMTGAPAADLYARKVWMNADAPVDAAHFPPSWGDRLDTTGSDWTNCPPRGKFRVRLERPPRESAPGRWELDPPVTWARAIRLDEDLGRWWPSDDGRYELRVTREPFQRF